MATAWLFANGQLANVKLLDTGKLQNEAWVGGVPDVVLLDPGLNVLEVDHPSESVTIAIPPLASVADQDTATESVTVRIGVTPSVSDRGFRNIDAVNLTAGADTSNLGAGGGSYATASISPKPNQLIFLAVACSLATAPSSISGNGLTWVEVTRVSFQTIASPAKMLILYRAMGTSPTPGVVTINFGSSMNGICWAVDQLDGVDTSGTNGSGAVGTPVTNASDSAPSLAVTLATLAATSASYGAFCALTSTTTINPGSGYAELSEQTHSAPVNRLQTEWKRGTDNTVDAETANGTSTAWGGIAVEVLAAPGSIDAVESVTITILATPILVSVVDDVLPTEMAAVEIASGLQVVAFDDDAVTEAVSILVHLYVAVVDEPLTPTEYVELDYPNLAVVVSEDDAAAEAVVVALNTLFIDVSDSPAPVEAVTVSIPMSIAVSDDNTFPPLEPPPMPATGIARDYIDVQEGFTMGLGIPVLVWDDTPGADDVVVRMGIPVQAADAISVADVIDTDAVTINPVLVGFDQVVADTVTPADVVILVRTVVVLAVDALTPTELAQASLPIQVVAADDAAPADVPAVRMPVGIGAVDDQPSSDFAAGELSVLLVVAVDDQAVDELVGGGIPMSVLALDETEIGERRNIRAFLDDLHFIDDAGAVFSTTGARVTRKS